MPQPIPPLLLKQNVTLMQKGAYNALLGEAHQYLVTGILMRLGFQVSVITVRAGTYDLIISAFVDIDKSLDKTVLVRAQVRTITRSLKFTGGIRGGVDRIYIPGVKEYKYGPQHNDLIIGVDRDTMDLYFVPNRFITRWGKSVSKNKLQILKNNVEILLHWNDEHLNKLEQSLPK